MKKVLSLMIAVLFTGTAMFAQTAMTKFSVDLVSPAPSTVLTNGTSFTQSFVVTVTQGSITPTDTFGWQDPAGAWRSNRVLTKNLNDTIQVSTTYTPNTTIPGASNYCVAAYLRLPGGVIASNFDTTGGTYIDCNSITLNFAAGIGEFTLSKTVENQKITVSPNPAIGETINLDYIAQNASEVEVNVFDISGRKVLSHSYGQAFKGQEGFSLDIAALNNGMYILELKQEGVKATAQFIK